MLRGNIKNAMDDVEFMIEKITRKKKSQNFLKNKLSYLQKLQKMKDNVEKIENFVEKKELKNAVKLFKKTEELIFSNLKGAKIIKILKNRLEKKRVLMINESANFAITEIFALIKKALFYKKSKNVKNYQKISPNFDMSILGHSYLNGSALDSSLLGRKDKDYLVPIEVEESLDLDNEAVENLIVIIVNFLSIKDYKISQFLDSIVDSLEQRMQELFNIIKETIEENNHHPNSVISSIVVLDNLLSKFIIFIDGFLKKLKKAIFKRFYNAIKSRFLRDRMMSSVTDIFMTTFELVKYQMRWFKLIGDFLSQNEILKNFKMNDLEDYLGVFNTFWSKFSDFKCILAIEIEPKKISSRILESIMNTFESINSILYDEELEVSANETRISIIKNFIKIQFQEKIKKMEKNVEIETWTPIDLKFKTQEQLNFLLFECLEDQNMLLKDEEEDQFNGTRLLDATQLIGSKQKRREGVMVIKKEVHVEGERFMVSGAFEGFLEALDEGVRLMDSLGDNGGEEEVQRRLVDIFMIYTSRSKQMILNGGAVLLNTLETVTTKNFALSMLELLLISKVISTLKIKLGIDNNILGGKIEEEEDEYAYDNKEEFDIERTLKNLQSDIEEHIKLIIEKISSEFLTACQNDIDNLLALPWTDLDSKISLPTQETGEILSNFKQLYRELEDFLTKNLTLRIFSKIFQKLNDFYIEPLIEMVEEKLEILHERGELQNEEKVYKRLADEFGYFISSVKDMGVFAGFGDFEEMVARLKEIMSLLEEEEPEEAQ